MLGMIIIVFLCIGVAIFWGGLSAKKRSNALSELATRLGLQFNPAHNYKIATHYNFLNKLRQGSNRYAYNIFNGKYQGHPIITFDYHYETKSRDSKGHTQTHHHHFSFFILTMEKAFPELTITKEGFFSKIAQAIGFDDIDFESVEFSKRFAVHSKDKKFAYDFCNGQMIDYLLGHPNINLEVDRNSLAIGFNVCLSAERIEMHLHQLVHIRSLMPNYLFTS